MDKSFSKGFEYFKKNKPKQAEQSLKKCLAKDSRHFDALHLIGIIHLQSNRLQLAIDYFKRAYKVKNNVIELNHNYTKTLLKLSKFGACLSLVDDMLKNYPSDIELLKIKAESLFNNGEFSSAVDVYQQLIQNSAIEIGMLGQAKSEAARRNYSVAIYKVNKVIEDYPDNFEAYEHCVQYLFGARLHSELIDFCLKYYEKFREINVKRAFDYAYESLKHLSGKERESKYRALHNIVPLVPDGLLELHVKTHHSPVFDSIEDISEYRKTYDSAIELCNKVKINFPCERLRPSSHFYLSYNGVNNKGINQKLSKLYPLQNDNELKISSSSRKKVLVISDLLYDRHTIYKLNAGLLRGLLKGLLDITVWVPVYDAPVSIEKLKKDVRDVCLVSNDIEVLIGDIKKFNPDFIFYPEIGMSDLIYCLAHERLAPIQFTSWGHPETSGIKNIDFFVSSSLIEPEECSAHYSEKLIKLDKLPAIYSEIFVEDHLSPYLHDLVSDQEYITCLQSVFKFHPEFDQIIRSILVNNPNIKLYILDSESLDLLMQRFEKNGIDLSRVVSVPRMKNSDFLNFYRNSLLALDPIHFGSGNTVYEAMSLGVPVVTMPGEFMRGRVTYGAYKQMNLESLIADSKEDYVNIVSRLIQDKVFYEQVKKDILLKKDALFQTEDVAIELEEKLLGLINNVK